MEKTVGEITHPDDLERDMAYVAEMRAGTRTEWEHEKRYIRKDGTTAWGHASVALVDDIGEHSHVVSLVQDITSAARPSRSSAPCSPSRSSRS